MRRSRDSWRRLRGLLLAAAVVVVALLAAVFGAVVGLIAHDLKWPQADGIAAVGVAAVVGGGITAMFGPFLVERLFNRPPPKGPIQIAREEGALDERKHKDAVLEALRNEKRSDRPQG